MSTAKVTFSNWSAQFNPEWAGDFLSREHLVPGGAKLVYTEFLATLEGSNDVTVTLTATAIVGATSLAVTALSGPIPSGTTLYFGAGLYAHTTAAVAAGAVEIPVEALPVQIASEATATYDALDDPNAIVNVPSGTVVGRTYAERDAGTGFGPAATTDDDIYLLAFDVTNVTDDNDCDLYRHGGIVKENFLPGIDTMSAGLLAEVRARYEVTIGAV